MRSVKISKNSLAAVAVLGLISTSLVASMPATANLVDGCDPNGLVAENVALGEESFGGGLGTVASPWQICSVAQLRAIETNDVTLDANYVLKTDLNITESQITGAVSDGTTITYTTSAIHPYRVGDVVNISGVTPADFNLSSEVVTAVSSSTSFTVAEAGVVATYASGGVATNLAWQPIGTARVAAASGNGVTVTLTTASAHPFQTGDTVTVITSNSFSSSTKSITRISSTQLSFADAKTSNFESNFMLYEKPFIGVFNGDGHSISGIRGASNFTKYQFGLFHTIGVTGTVRDLSISGEVQSNATSSSTNQVEMGLLAYQATTSFINRINVTSASLSAPTPTTGYALRFGSLVAQSSGTKFDQINVQDLLIELPFIAANGSIGGIGGQLTGKTDLRRVSVQGEIRGVYSNTINSATYLGGVVGNLQDSSIAQAHIDLSFTNPADAVPLTTTRIYTGGVAGLIYGSEFRDIFIEIDADGHPNFGGLAGKAEERRTVGITNSISRVISRVTQENLGNAGNPVISNTTLDTTTGVSVANSFFDSTSWGEGLAQNLSKHSIVDFTGDGTVVTYTTGDAHGLSVGDVISLQGIVPSEYSLVSVAVASVPSTTTFTVASTVTGVRNASYTGYLVKKDSSDFAPKTTAELKDSSTYSSWTVADTSESVANDGWLYSVVQAATTNGSPRNYTTSGPHSFVNRLVTITGAQVSNYNQVSATLSDYTSTSFSVANQSNLSNLTRVGDASVGNPTFWEKSTGQFPVLIWRTLPFDTEIKYLPNYQGSLEQEVTRRAGSYPASIGSNPFTRPGYSLAYWNTSPDGTGSLIEATTGNVPRSVYLYAQWRASDANASQLYETYGQAISPAIQAAPGDTIWASAIERSLSTEIFSSSVQADGAAASEEYAYRITKTENDISSSLDAQASTGYTVLTAQQQTDWYTSLGFNQNNPYEFRWSAFLCVDDTTFELENPISLNYSYSSREKGILPNDGFETSQSVFFNDAVQELIAQTSPSTRTVVGDDTTSHKYLGTPRGEVTALAVTEVNGNCAPGTTLTALRLLDETSVAGNPVYLTEKSIEVPQTLKVLTADGEQRDIASTGVTIGVTGVRNQADFNAALWGITKIGLPAPTGSVAAPSVPYEGPLNVRVLSSTICSGQEVILTGERLNTVGSIEVGAKQVDFKLLANGNLSYSLKDIPVGIYQVKLWVPVNSVNLTINNVVENCGNTAGKVNVGSFNGKLVVYAAGLEGKRISWKVGGKWGRQVATSSFARFDRPTPRKGVTVSVQIFIDGVPALTRSVLTR